MRSGVMQGQALSHSTEEFIPVRIDNIPSVPVPMAYVMSVEGYKDTGNQVVGCPAPAPPLCRWWQVPRCPSWGRAGPGGGSATSVPPMALVH